MKVKNPYLLRCCAVLCPLWISLLLPLTVFIVNSSAHYCDYWYSSSPVPLLGCCCYVVAPGWRPCLWSSESLAMIARLTRGLAALIYRAIGALLVIACRRLSGVTISFSKLFGDDSQQQTNYHCSITSQYYYYNLHIVNRMWCCSCT